MKYKASYYYMASGMDYPDEHDIGCFEAPSIEEALELALDKEMENTPAGPTPKEELREWIAGCISLSRDEGR